MLDQHDETYLVQLGERLRLARTRRGMTQRVLAARSGVSLRFIVQTEAGTGNLSVLRLRELAGALGIPPADLLADRVGGRAAALLADLSPARQEEAAALLAVQPTRGVSLSFTPLSHIQKD